jgi:hypothetical protein
MIERPKPSERGIESAIPNAVHLGALAFGRFPIFYLSKARSDSRRARRFFEALIIVPAVYLALQQQPAARSIALMSLGRKRGCTLARAMEGDRDIRRRNAPTGSRYSGLVYA